MEEIEFNRGFSFKKGNKNAEFAFFFVNVVDGTDKVGEGSVGDFDNIVDSKAGLKFRFVLFDGFEYLGDFFLRNGGRFVVDADKSGDSLSGADGNPGIIGNNHLDENITGESLFLGFYFFAAADNRFALDGDNGLEDFICKPHGFDTSFKSVDDLVFMARIGVDDIPGGINAGFFA